MTDDNIIRLLDASGLIPAHFYSDATSNPLFLAGERVDGRRRIALRYRALCESFVCDLGGSVTTGQSSLVTLAAAWTVQSEMLVAEDAEWRPSVHRRPCAGHKRSREGSQHPWATTGR